MDVTHPVTLVVVSLSKAILGPPLMAKLAKRTCRKWESAREFRLKNLIQSLKQLS